jgi:hypothetical protein
MNGVSVMRPDAGFAVPVSDVAGGQQQEKSL